jgi:hypothetical protein
MKMEQCSETSAYKIQMAGNYPEESSEQEPLTACERWEVKYVMKETE